MQTLMRRNGSLTAVQQHSWLYTNLPDYCIQIKRFKYTDICSFIQELEFIKKEIRNAHSGTTERRSTNIEPIRTDVSQTARTSYQQRDMNQTPNKNPPRYEAFRPTLSAEPIYRSRNDHAGPKTTDPYQVKQKYYVGDAERRDILELNAKEFLNCFSPDVEKKA